MLTALDGTPAPGGTWTNSAGTTISGSFSVQNTGAGTYNYYYPNVGCNPQGATLNILVEPLGNAGNSYSGSICSASGTLNLNALLSAGSSTNGVWYNASNQIINPVITLSELAEQEYTYFINGGVCPDDYSFFDIIVDSPPMDLPDTTLLLCSTSDPIDLIASLPPAGAIQFLDQNGLSVSSIFDPSAGVSSFYSISIPSGNICPPGQGSINIQVENPINLDPVVVTICENTTTINLETLAPSFAAWNGTWFLNNGTPVNPVTTWDPSMVSFYFVPNEALACPVDTGFLNIQVSSFQASSALPSFLYCELDPAFDLMTLLPASWSNNGAWSLNNTSLSGTILNPINASSGNYLYTIPGIGSCPEATLTVPISITQLPSYAPIADLYFCADQNQVTLGSNETNNAYAWSPGLYLDDPSSAMPILTADLVEDQITLLEYTVSVSNAACTLLDTVQVTFYPQPQIELSDVYSLCLGQSLNINLPLGNQYAWEPSSYFSNPNASAQNIQPLNSSNISVTVQNVWGCESSLSAFIDVNTNPDFELEFNPQSGCYVVNDTLNATGLGDYTYAWNIAGETYSGSTIELALYDAGIYSLEITATDSIGCQTVIQQASVYEVYPSPTAIFEADPSEVTTVNNQSQMINLTTTANQFQWQLDGAEFSTTVAPLVTFPSLEERNYEVCLIATNATGCQDTSCIFVHIENEYLLWAPNAFTPDGDQINDVFEIQSNGFDATQYSLRIYDRWGLEVFSSADPAAVWTGNHANGAYYCQPDVYSWILEVKPSDMADYLIYKGHVNLIR
jgi:gliding motility-associated-like protein